MKFYRLVLLLAAAFAMVLAACGDDDGDSGSPTVTNPGGASATSLTPTGPFFSGPFFDCDAQHASTEPDASYFPVTVTDGNGDEVTITEPPVKIASLDAAHTEILYAIGAGDQVSAVDNTSNCPVQVNALSARVDAFTPSVEAITGLEPDLVILFYDPGDLVTSLRAAGLSVLYLLTPVDLEATYDDVKLIGNVTGHPDEAEALATSMVSEVAAIKARVAGEDAPTVYHEVDNTYYSAGPGSFIDDLYNVLGAENIAASTGQAYPQLSSEAIIAANPDVIILADEIAGESAETVGGRPGWSVVAAVESGRIYGIDPDITSRPGPRIVDALRALETLLYYHDR